MVSATHLPSTPATMSKPSKSILKTPSSMAGQKRKKIDMDLSSDLTPRTPDSDSFYHSSTIVPSSGRGSPTKRHARVKFDTGSPPSYQGRQSGKSSHNKQLQSSQNADNGTALAREEVRRAIHRHVFGDSEGYDRIKEMFTMDPKAIEEDGSPVYDLPSPSSLKNYLMGLLSNISALDGSCSGLVHAVLASEWVGRDSSYVNLFVRFLATLSAAQGGYLNAILKMLVGGLRQVMPRAGNLPGYNPIRNSEIYSRFHFAIHYVAQLIPACCVSLYPILSSTFPHDTDTVNNHYIYTNNLIKVIDYIPELRSDILALITEKLVKIDSQNQVDFEELDEETQYEIQQELNKSEMLKLDDEDDEPDDKSALSDDYMIEADAQRKKVLECMFKVDYMIDTLFEYYATSFVSGSMEDQEKVLDLLLAHFQSIILPTYRSSHTQFLLFHFSQTSQIFIDRFATTCIELISNKSQSIILRQYAAAYLASFVSRGAHVSGEVVRDVFNLLGSYVDNFCSKHEKDCRGPDLRRYGLFYANAQALFYIFCFRWKDLTIAALEAEAENRTLGHLDVDDVSFPPSIKDVFHRAIYSKLNPLKVCSTVIVSEFARITNHFSFLYLYPLLEANKRIRIHTFRGLTSMAMDHMYGTIERETRADDNLGSQLDDYFPFDPYRLQRSRRWLDGDYLEYEDVRVSGLDDRHDDDDDTASEEDDELDDIDSNTETDEEEE